MHVTTYLLLPSALLGAVAWEPVAETLRSTGERVAVASTAGCATAEEVLAAYVAAAPGGDDVVVVPHSNAGYFAPAVADRLRATGVVYVDAALPAGSGASPLAPPGFLEFLTGLADDEGLLPPWSRWWPDGDGLFPDAATRDRVRAVEPRLPLAYFWSTVAAPAGWQSAPAAYLGFGDTYAEEQERAAALGWPSARLEGGHLLLLHEPDACAAALVGLRGRLG